MSMITIWLGMWRKLKLKVVSPDHRKSHRESEFENQKLPNGIYNESVSEIVRDVFPVQMILSRLVLVFSFCLTMDLFFLQNKKRPRSIKKKPAGRLLLSFFFLPFTMIFHNQRRGRPGRGWMRDEGSAARGKCLENHVEPQTFPDSRSPAIPKSQLARLFLTDVESF